MQQGMGMGRQMMIDRQAQAGTGRYKQVQARAWTGRGGHGQAGVGGHGLAGVSRRVGSCCQPTGKQIVPCGQAQTGYCLSVTYIILSNDLQIVPIPKL